MEVLLIGVEHTVPSVFVSLFSPVTSKVGLKFLTGYDDLSILLGIQTAILTNTNLQWGNFVFKSEWLLC